MTAQTYRGKASYYSKRATGARAASGERLHHDSLTCAHRTYPFGTTLRVKNLSNGKEILVRVTDRGPYGRGRIIDLSYGAARELGMLAQGVAMVEVERVDGVKPPYRISERETGLPDFEFDVTKAGYSFIDEWTRERSVNKEVVQDASRSIANTKKTEESAQRPKPAGKHAETVPKTAEAGLKKPENMPKKPEMPLKKTENPAKKTTDPVGKMPETPVKKTTEPAGKKSEPAAKKPEPTAKKPETTGKKPENPGKKPEPQSKKAEPQKKTEDPSVWGNVFDKVKNWFEK